MTTLMQAHEQWAKRPADERFLSLHEMQAKMRSLRDRSEADVQSTRKIEVLPDEIDPRHRGLTIGIDNGPLAGLAMEQIGDAARGIAAGLGRAAICIADAHQDLGRGMARRLQQDDLIASDAGPPIRQPAYGCGAERDRTATKVEHDKIVAEPMHFVKRDLAHDAALYGGGDRSVQRC